MRGKTSAHVLRPGSEAEYRRRVNAVVLYVTQHLGEDLDLAAMAREACFSQYHFHRLFTSLLGETPADFVKRLKVEKAANMLHQQPALSITAVGMECGFSSPAVFSRAFRDQLRCSPTAWRLRKNRTVLSKNRKAPGVSGKYLSVVPHPHKQSKGDAAMNVSIKKLDAVRVAYVANLGGYSREMIGRAWETLCRWAGPRGLLGPNATLIGISFDNPEITPADRCRYYACLAVGPEIVPEDAVQVMEIQGGSHAVSAFRGTLADIPRAYSEFYGTWLPASGYQPADRPSYEIYRTPPDARPDGLFTMDICMPVEPLRRGLERAQ